MQSVISYTTICLTKPVYHKIFSSMSYYFQSKMGLLIRQKELSFLLSSFSHMFQTQSLWLLLPSLSLLFATLYSIHWIIAMYFIQKRKSVLGNSASIHHYCNNKRSNKIVIASFHYFFAIYSYSLTTSRCQRSLIDLPCKSISIVWIKAIGFYSNSPKSFSH